MNFQENSLSLSASTFFILGIKTTKVNRGPTRTPPPPPRPGRVKRAVSVANAEATDVNANNTGKKVIFKSCAPFTNFISHINNIQVDKAKDIDGVMPMYNLIEHSDVYSKTSGNLW